MNKTKIPWCDWTWNPIVGCSPASEGCAHCYAAAISKRFHLPWGSAHFMPDRLDQPAKMRKPGRVFVCSMADLGHETVKPGWREEIYDAMMRAPWHTYIVLTKRPGPWLRQLPCACWVNVTIENQAHINRWPLLWNWAWPGALKGVSVEPMLGPVTFSAWRGHCEPDWVIAGPETGPKARPCKADWIEALSKESPCFFDKRDVWEKTRREWPERKET
jgi:protein gp37